MPKKKTVQIKKDALAKVNLHVPHGCKRDKLSIFALDSHTRELAYGTTIEIDGKPLLCCGFELRTRDGHQTVAIEVVAPCFEIIEKEKENA